MKTIKNFYIKERHNPQFDKPYYVACGQLSKRKAKEAERTVYGENIMLPFSSIEDYESKISQLKNDGFTVANN